MPDKHAEIEAALLKLLYVRPLAIQDITNPPSTQMVRDAYPTHAAFLTNDNWESVNQAVWALVRRGLAWINMGSMHSTGLWRIILTEKGRLAACGEAVTPEDPTGYMERLLRDVPGTSDVVKLYLNEALSSYVEGCYLASTVMLGVAAEACMLDTAETYVNWAGKRAEKLREHLENSRTFYVAKLQEFQKRLSVDKTQFPFELGDALELDVTAVLQLIRLNRNDAGHPTGKTISRDDCYSRLCIYASVHKKLHALQAFFQSPTTD